MPERNITARLKEIGQRERIREGIRRVARLPIYVIGILGISALPTAFYLYETDIANRVVESKSLQSEWTQEMADKLNGSRPLSPLERFVDRLQVTDTETGYLTVRSFPGTSFPNGIRTEPLGTLPPKTKIPRVLLTRGQSPYFSPLNPNSPKGEWAVFPCEAVLGTTHDPRLPENSICTVFAGYLEPQA